MQQCSASGEEAQGPPRQRPACTAFDGLAARVSQALNRCNAETGSGWGPTGHCADRGTEGGKDQQGRGLGPQMGGAGKIAPAQIAADREQQSLCGQDTQAQSEQAANQCNRESLQRNQCRNLPRRHAEYAQECQHGALAPDRQRQCGPDQERTGEQRHQRQDGEVDAICARQV